ncbi:efflux RND transporter periplasmic adaptor subunit [Fusibacter bizertensis]|uniref:Efflux RND transporter periplasmic adaptor subunit n=1 Tax=Fusibacter bizertensis TaxID=1488331 RepID=A0ABT6NEH4_9FIRM|nr:efflux RND transporter periplasmic adaptor subunit [Fusibacter bizertensis]MDH8678801.1 efflux RND transporter periplasmic adaptor subunit [Fusibacter bizertensis]
MKSFFKKKRNKRIVIGIVVLLILFIVLPRILGSLGDRQANMDSQYTMVSASNKDITVTLSGTGTLKPADSYTVMSLNSGDVISAPFEEGDVVEKDSVLYEIDSSNLTSNIETAEISVAESQRSYQRMLESLDDLTVKAQNAGTVMDFDIEVGDSVQVGQTIATIRDSKTMTIELPFGADDASHITVGQQANVTISGSFETLGGIVSEVSPIVSVLPGGMQVRQVTISVANPGGLLPTYEATAVIGDYACFESATFKYKAEGMVIAKASGDVAKVFVREGDFIAKDASLIVLDSTTLQDQIQSAKNTLRRSEISLESSQDALDGYVISSPIGGTVIEKNYKEGDTLSAGNPLCTIFDLSYLSMTLYIDELDISQISVGQPVTITAEAVEGKTYAGLITKVNINGVTSGGTTSYPVTIRIDEIEGLLPGMNVDAEIVIESRERVLAVPVAAVVRGNKVLVKTSGEETTNSDTPVTDAPSGYKYIEITTGISDTNYIEILSGLNEGDEVAIENRTVKDVFMFGRPGQNDQPSDGTGVDTP